MKIKSVTFVVAGCLLASAAWIAIQKDAAKFNMQKVPVAVAQDAELEVAPNPSRADRIPKQYHETVRKGLEYLIKRQCEDGHWEDDGGQQPVAMTGLAGLALLMEDNKPSRRKNVVMHHTRKYSANIGKAVDWLIDMSESDRDGLIYSEHASETARYMPGHGLATLFLAGVLQGGQDGERSKKLTEVLTLAVKYILKAQSSQGGWYFTSKVEGHDFDTISVTALQIQALQAAEIAGIPVPAETINHAQKYLEMAIGKYQENAKAGLNRSRQADTAAALACRIGLNHVSRRISFYLQEDTSHDKWREYCQTEIATGRDIQFGSDEFIHYFYAQAVFNHGQDTAWVKYRTAMFDHLKRSQNEDGSWPVGDGKRLGPVHAAAVWCIILQLDKGNYPSVSSVVLVTT